MINNFETRILIYSLILGAAFLFAVYLACRFKPDKHNQIISGKN